jgi:hypothetical protein
LKAAQQAPTPSPTDKGSPKVKLSKEARRAFEAVTLLSQGERSAYSDTSSRFRLSPEQWATLQDYWLGSSVGAWVEDKLRCNYDADKQELELLMPGYLHEHFVSELKQLILEKLRELATNAIGENAATIQELVKKIRDSGSPSIGLDKKNARSPDISFRFRPQKVPSFVAEVAVSQNGREEFEGIAEQYFEKSKGRIRTFLGIDIEYRAPKKLAEKGMSPQWGEYRLYRFTLEKDAESDTMIGQARLDAGPVEFRLSEKERDAQTPSPHLTLSLADFCPQDAAAENVDLSQHTISFSHDELAAIVDDGEAYQAESDNNSVSEEAAESAEAFVFLSKRKHDEVEARDDHSDPSSEGNGDDPEYKGGRVEVAADVQPRRSKRTKGFT